MEILDRLLLTVDLFLLLSLILNILLQLVSQLLLCTRHVE